MRLILARMIWAFDVETGPDKGVDWEAQKVFFLVQKLPLEVGSQGKGLRRSVDRKLHLAMEFFQTAAGNNNGAILHATLQ